MVEKILRQCSVCNAIDVGMGNNSWMNKKTNPQLYNLFQEKYEGKISHTYCPPCTETEMEKLKKEFIQ